MSTSQNQTITMRLKDGSTITVTVDGGGDAATPQTEVQAPPRVAPLTVSDTGPGGQRMSAARNPLWRAFRQPDLGDAVRECLAAALAEGGGNMHEFFADVQKFIDRTPNNETVGRHANDVLFGLMTDNEGNEWYGDTDDPQLVSGASACIFMSRNGTTVPPVLMALATDILRARQRGYVVVALVGYRLFLARAGEEKSKKN